MQTVTMIKQRSADVTTYFQYVGNTVLPQASGFQKLAKLTIFGVFNELLSPQNVNVARFARNLECDFFCDFQTPCLPCLILLAYLRLIF